MSQPENHDGPRINLTDQEAPPAARKQTKAVALHYEASGDDAPRVVASGKGAVADQIISLAFAHGVRVREDAALVDILGALDVDSPIPLEAFAAVAEILSYVYRADEMYGRTRTNSFERKMP
ncbi:MAG: EscU/YscU/HrcU family type III secretion system export apparatus switch protein [Rickettsiales bacterium]|nr:EscU/YscU/HrcU family type III secretion system export apparatus switch protein [Rickettsiales bacterium]